MPNADSEENMNSVGAVIGSPNSNICANFRSILTVSAGFTIVAEPSNGHDGLRAIMTQSPEVVLVDSKLPGLSGAAITSQIKHSFPNVLVVLLAPYAGYDVLLSSAHCGAAAVLPFDADAKKVTETLNGALGGFARLHPWALPNADVERDLLHEHPERDSIGQMLTARQAEVLDCLL